MDEKHFKETIKAMEHVAVNFRGWTLTEEQFQQVDELWNEVRYCYFPCREPTKPSKTDDYDRAMRGI